MLTYVSNCLIREAFQCGWQLCDTNAFDSFTALNKEKLESWTVSVEAFYDSFISYGLVETQRNIF